jgi:hypothetical protein
MARNQGIFVMPTIGEQIGPELQQLGSVLANIKNPNRDIQVSLRQAIAQNPDLLQKLIDMGPEKIATIFGKEASFLGEGEKSLGEQLKQEVSTRFKTDDTFKGEYIAGQTGTKTATDRLEQTLGIKGKEVGIKAAESNLRVAEATEDAQIQQVLDGQTLLRQKVTDMQQAVNAIPNIGAIDLNKTIMDAFRGRGDPEVLMRLQQANIDIGPMVSALQQQAQIAAQFSLAKLREQSKEIKFMALDALTKRSDDTQRAIQLADNVIKDLQKPVQMAKMVMGGKTPKDSPFYLQAQQTVAQYEQALAQKKAAEDEYAIYNPKRNMLIDNLIGKESKTGGSTTTKTTTTERVGIEEIAPPELLGDIAKLNAANPLIRKSSLEQIKKLNPAMYDKIFPFVK